MTDDKNTFDLGKGFEKKSSKFAASKTDEERRDAGEKVIQALDAASKEARAKDLTEEIGRQILNEYYDEKYGKKGDDNA